MSKKNNKKNLTIVSKKSMEAPMRFDLETVQQTIPILAIHEEHGLIETYKGCFVRVYYLGDNNYMTAPDEEQLAMFAGWRRVLNSFGSNMEFSVSINNRTMNIDDIRESVMMKETGDSYDYLRKQMNKINCDRVAEGNNSIKKDKYLTVAIHEASPAKAAAVFSRLDRDIDGSLSRISSYAKPVQLEDMLEIIYGLYNDPSEHFIQKTKVFNDEGKTVEISSFDFKHMRQMGLSINDLIGPTSIRFYKNKIKMGKKWVRVLRLADMPSQMNDQFMSNVTDLGFNCLTTINYKPLTPKEADIMVNKNLAMIRDEKTKRIREGQKNGVFDDTYIPPSILEREAEALALRDDMHENDEKLFKTTFTVAIFADDEEMLDHYTETVITEYKKASAHLTVLENQQEEGFNTTLPLCYNQMKIKRTLKSSSAAILLPFNTMELNDPNGIIYSCNLNSKNLLSYDRLAYQNFNAFILGTPGSGKSFTAKTEMLNVFLKTDADIVVIDPENEYAPLAKLLGGEVIKIEPGGNNHINPMEITQVDMSVEEDGLNPINTKADFILRLCECIMKSPFGINSIQETIIDECVHELFRPFMGEDGELDVIPPEEMPTLTDLQKAFAKRREPEARELATALKLYTGDGSLNVFGYRSNVSTSKRFVVYQIKDVGDRLKNLAMLTILDHIWNQIVENRKIGKPTWFYVDEIYLLFQNEYSASFLNTLFRRARKYMGVPTGITQNVTPLLESPTARDMLQNCNCIQILQQAAPDRAQLKVLLNLSDTQLNYITSSPKGQGLFYTGSSVVPFYSSFPKNNDCYKVLTSDAREIKQIELEKKRDEARKNKEQ